jgi:organic radical activating enzyme
MNVANVIEIWSGIQGEGTLAGVRQVFVRLAGCNLDCDYCDTPGAHGWTDPAEIETAAGAMAFRREDNPMRPEQVVAEVRRLAAEVPVHSVSWTGGEPLWSSSFLAEAIPPLREAGLAQFLETNGTLADELAKVVALFDFICADIKLPRLARGVADLESCRRFLTVAREAGRCGCAKLVFDGETSAEEIAQAASMAAEAGFVLVLQPVSPTTGGPGAPSTEQVLRAHADALAHGGDVRVIPQLHPHLGLR